MHTSNYSFCGLLHGLECIESDVENMADDTKLFSIAEEGCLRVSSHIRQVVYHRSLNVLLVFSSNGPRETEIKVVVLDIASGTVLHETKLSLASSSTTGSESQGGDEGVSSAPLKGKSNHKKK